MQESTKNSRKFLNLASKKGGYHPILTLGASKDWPKRALLLPGIPKLLINLFSSIILNINLSDKKVLRLSVKLDFCLPNIFSRFLPVQTIVLLTSSPTAGNQISFLLRSVTKINKQQLNDSDWGFSCKITGYKFKKERRTLHHLEHILADLAGSCVRVMISPCNNSLQKLSQVRCCFLFYFLYFFLFFRFFFVIVPATCLSQIPVHISLL